MVPLTDLRQAEPAPVRPTPVSLARLREQAVVEAASAPATEDREMSRLLVAGLQR